jgi:glutaredoxin-like protein
VNDYGKPQNDEAQQDDQTQELIDQLNLLEDVDRRITPEHVAQRFRELLDAIGDGGPPSPAADRIPHGIPGQPGCDPRLAGPWRRYDAEPWTDPFGLTGSLEAAVAAARSAAAEIIADAELKAKTAKDELRHAQEAAAVARQQAEQFVADARAEADKALERAVKMVRDAGEQAERIISKARSEAEQIITAARNQQVHQTAWTGNIRALEQYGLSAGRLTADAGTFERFAETGITVAAGKIWDTGSQWDEAWGRDGAYWIGPSGGGMLVLPAHGGMGKTALAVRLAREAAKRSPDGALFVDPQGYDPGKLGLTPAAIWRHAYNLLAEGLMETRTARKYGNRGRGRPAKVFGITDAGRNAFEHAYDDLATGALRFLAETAGPYAVAEFTCRQLAALERRRFTPVVAQRELAARVQALAEALSADGYAASAAPAPAEFPQLCEAETETFGRLLGTPVQRLATIAHGDGICTTHVTSVGEAVLLPGSPAQLSGSASEGGDVGDQRVSGQLTMYTTPWCGFCRNLKRQLARDGIEVAEVDIERDEAAAEFVMSVNGGRQTVPTVVFPDGTVLADPSAVQVKAHLAAMAKV